MLLNFVDYYFRNNIFRKIFFETNYFKNKTIISQPTMTSKNKRKISEENRGFENNWDEEYFVILNKQSSATYLIFRETIILKKYKQKI